MNDRYTLHHGDCLDVMRRMEENSIDTVITDPPYGLQFMGKDWDHGIPGIPFWAEALRVAKPGAMLLAFGGTRTYHRLACAIEDAGWIIRDDIAFLMSLDEKERAFFDSLDECQQQAFLDLFASQGLLLWVYGSGFPKSANISKMLDKRAGAEREVVGQNQWSGRQPNKRNNSESLYGDFNAENHSATTITAPATDAARLWDGWGTALKPSWEPVLLAMKPLDGTFAENALVWGCAGLNVDGARVEGTWKPVAPNNGGRSAGIMGNKAKHPGGECHPQGRWPANLILSDDPEVTAGFPNSKGCKSTFRGFSNNGSNDGWKRKSHTKMIEVNYGDSGSAARYFYCAKSSKRERNHGLPDGVTNKHPTVKPVSLCQYLARLTKTPIGGIVLDPFCGSGSIGVGAIREGRQFIGIDQDADSIEVSGYRLAAAVEETRVTQMELELNEH